MRIADLDQITNEAIDLSQELAIDDPSQTFKLTLLQLRDFFTGQLFPVGSTMFRLDNRTPNECGFPGTWNKIAADLSLHTAAADGSNVGATSGSNSQVVPLPTHSHPGSAIWVDAVGDHDHGAGGSQDAHDHAITIYNGGMHTHNVNTRVRGDYLTDGRYWGAGGTGSSEHHTDGTYYPIALEGGEHNHGAVTDFRAPNVYVDVLPAGSHAHSGGVTVAADGVASPVIDVRGACILGHLWHRTA